jgi:hypothetical protein
MRTLRSFLARPRTDKALLAEAAGELARAWWRVRRQPFRAYAPGLGRSRPGDFHDETPPTLPRHELARLRWALERLNRLAGGRFTCLMLAMAGQRMLVRRGQSGTLVLGVDPGGGAGGDALGAHAWLCAGPHVVVGADERAGHIAVVSYHATPAAG